MGLYLDQENVLTRFVIRELYALFPDVNPKHAHFEDRVKIIADDKMYRPDDEFIWRQKRGDTARHFQIYFDGEFICTVTEDVTPARLSHDFFKGFKTQYAAGNVRVAPQDYVITMTVDEVAKSKKATTPTEKMAQEIAQRLIK